MASILRSIFALSVLFFVAACDIPIANVTKEGAVKLLNSGRVKSIGVTQSGFTSLMLHDGFGCRNRSSVIGFPKELLDQCIDCSNVSTWIE